MNREQTSAGHYLKLQCTHSGTPRGILHTN